MAGSDTAKRAMDVAISLPALFVALPVILLAMLAIRLTSSGPAIIVQSRIGRFEKPFRCLKLRTMRNGTPVVPTHETSAGQITPVGNFLRRTKIDELPQLWNVLTGDMSLVGPRPCLPTQHVLIEQRRRLGVYTLRPGITGLAQTRGIDMSRPELLAQTDAEYLATRSAARDLKLIWHTLFGSAPAALPTLRNN